MKLVCLERCLGVVDIWVFLSLRITVGIGVEYMSILLVCFFVIRVLGYSFNDF